MLDTIVGALLPLVVTFLLGFVAAWRRDFGPTDASILNRMVLLYAVPLMLFAGTASTPRTELSQDITLLGALCVAIVGLYGVVLLVPRFAFRQRMSTSALAALTASAPAVLFGGSSRPRLSVRRVQRHSDRDSRSRHQAHGPASHDPPPHIGFDRRRLTGKARPRRTGNIRHRPRCPPSRFSAKNRGNCQRTDRLCRNPVSAKSGVSSEIRCQSSEIRCQCIILAQKDEPTLDYAKR